MYQMIQRYVSREIYLFVALGKKPHINTCETPSSLPVLWLQVLLELLGHTDAEHLPLEPVLGRELAKVMHVQ